VINPEEEIPGYVRIDEFDLTTSFPGEGTAHEKVSELWVYANGAYVGAYDLPAEVPILESGNTEIIVRAGIRNNGISADREIYPFYTNYITTVELNPGVDSELQPSFTYRENLAFWFENFDDPGIKFASPPFVSDTTIQVINDPEKIFSLPGEENVGSGVIYLKPDSNYFYGVTEDGIDLSPGTRTYCELTYKSNNSFVVGLEGSSAGSNERAAVLIILPTTNASGIADWNKIYIDMSFVLGSLANAQEFNLYIESYLDPGVEDGEIWLDNIKVVTFD
jgi:hypothetical protein